MVSFLGKDPKTKSAWEAAPGDVKQLVNDNAVGLVGISRDARKQYQADKAGGYQQYKGDRVADFTGTEQAGLDMLQALPGQQAGIEGHIDELGGLDQMLAHNPELIQQLYNPYQQDVIDTTMSDLDRLNVQAQQRRNAAAGAAGSFGGSRAGVMDALARGEETRSNAAVLGGLRQEGWNTAAGLASKDLDRSSAYSTNYMDVLRGLYGDKGSQGLAMSKGLEDIGTTQRGIAQSGADVAYGDWQERQNYPWTVMQRAQNVIGRTNPATDAAAAPTVSTPGSGGLLGTLVGAASAGAGAWMACDARLKRDVERVATLPSGAGLYRFAYLWDDPGVEHLGPVAQDLARFVPDAVAADGRGTLMVDMRRVR